MAQQAEFQKTTMKQISKFSKKEEKTRRKTSWHQSESDSSSLDWSVESNCKIKNDIYSSKDNDSKSSKLKRKKVDDSPDVPINIVNPKNIHSTSHQKGVTGRGIITTTSAILQLESNIES